MIQNIKHDHTETYWYTVRLGTGVNFNHSSALDAFQGKVGDTGAAGFGASEALTYTETNWTGEFERDYVCYGFGFELVARNNPGSTALTDAYRLVNYVNAKVKTSQGEIPLGPLVKWPAGESGTPTPSDFAGGTLTEALVIQGSSSKIMRLGKPIHFKKGDKPKIEFHPGATLVSPIEAFDLRVVMIGEHV